MAPIKTSSMLGWVAEVTEMVSPSQLIPSGLQRICNSFTSEGRSACKTIGVLVVAIKSPGVDFSWDAEPRRNDVIGGLRWSVSAQSGADATVAVSRFVAQLPPSA